MNALAHTITRWLITPFAAVAAAVSGAFAGEFIGITLGLWTWPIAGFIAEFGIGIATYLAAPRFKLAASTALLVLGVGIAWAIVEPSFYPQNFEPAYKPSHMPIIATVAGGALSLAIAVVLARRARAI